MNKLITLSSIIFAFIFTSTNVKAEGKKKNFRFNSGEKLEFVIYYGIINGGVATMELKKVKFKGEVIYYCSTEAKSTGLTDKLYRVKDVYASYFRPDSYLPYKSIRNINEGKYHKYDEAIYRHDSNLVRSTKRMVDSLPDDIRDMVSTFFYLRTVNYDSLKYGDIIEINTFFDDELFPFNMRYRGKEEIKTKLGTFNCIKLVPFVEPGRIFKTEDDMTIWLSPDLKYAPVRVKFDLMVGSLKIDLIKHSGIN